MDVGDGLPEAEGMGSRWSQLTWRWSLRNPKLPIPGALTPGPTTIRHPARLKVSSADRKGFKLHFSPNRIKRGKLHFSNCNCLKLYIHI